MRGLIVLALMAGLAEAQTVGSLASSACPLGGCPPPSSGAGSGNLTGTLTSGRVTLSTGATTVGDDAGCTWTGTGASFVMAVGAVSVSSSAAKLGYDAGSGDYGLHLANFTKVGWSSTAGATGAPNLALSSASAGLLLVEDGSGNARDVQARTVLGASTTTTLIESSATSFATLTYSASTVAGAEFLCRIRANDATDFQVLTSRVRVSTVRKATGNTVSAVGIVGTDLLAESAGGSTLSCTFTVVEGASAATLQANCVSSLTQTTLNISFLAEAVGPVVIAQL